MNEIVKVLTHNGFVSPQDDALDQLAAAAEGLMGQGKYATLSDMLADVVRGGGLDTPSDTPIEVAQLFWTAAYGSGSELESYPHEDGIRWGEI